MSGGCPVDLEPYGLPDLRFDFSLAEAVAAAARAAIGGLDGHRAARTGAVTSACEDFQGHFSELFVANATIASRDCSELIVRLGDVLTFISKLKAEARAENTRRRLAREWKERVEARRANWIDAAWDAQFGEEPAPSVTLPDPPKFDPSGVAVGARDTPPTSAGGSGGGTSSARPSNLRSFALGSRALDDTVSNHPGALAQAAEDFNARSDFGTINVEPVVAGFTAWLAANGNDAGWADTIAAAFENAGAGAELGTLSDVSLIAALAAAGVNADRTDLVIDPPSALGGMPTTGFANDPVNTSTGNFLEPEVDLACAGAAASLRFTRMYNSLDSSGGVFGRGWSSVLDARLLVSDESARFVQADGRHIVFPREGAGWARSTGENFWLGRERTDDAAELRLLAPADLAEMLVVRDNRGGWWAFTPSGSWLGSGRGAGTAVIASRDAAGRIVRLAHERGRLIDVEYAGERVAVVSASDGQRTEYLYDDTGHLIGAQDRVGTRRYRWNEEGLVDQVVAATGVVECENTYDAQGRVVAQLSSFGRRTRFVYLPGRVTEVSDAAGERANTWVADRLGRLIGVIDANGKRQSMAYDRYGNVVSVRERDGQTTVNLFDARGRKVRTVTPEGADLSYGYDEQDRSTTVVTASGGIVAFEYADAADRNPCQITDPVGGRTELTWQDGLLVRTVDPMGVAVSFEYDAFGELIGVTNALGATARLLRDHAGRVVEAITPSGARTRYRYDDAGLLVARESADGAVWRYEHGDGGTVTATIDPAGARTALEYGAHGELVRTIDPLGRAVEKEFDDLGNVASVTLPDGAEWAFVHDALSRLREITDPAGGVWSREYDAMGQLTATTDPTGVQTRVSRARRDGIETVRGAFEQSTVHRDEFGRPTRVEASDGSASLITYDACGRTVELLDADGGLTKIERDLAGRVVETTSPAGRVSRYEYDACGRPSAAVDAAGRRTTLTYDADSRVVARTLPGGDIVEIEYDRVGRVVREQTPGVGVSRYRYDRVGRLTGVQDTSYGKRTFRYDAAGQLVAAINGLGGVTRYEYDQRGRLLTTTDPLGGVTARTYTPLDKVSSSTDPLGRVTTATYDPAGRQLSQTDPDGTTTEWEYDEAGLERGLRVGGLQVSSIVRDARARTATITDHTRASSEVTHTLRFDRHGQLVSRSTDDGAGARETRWEYDADGFRSALIAPDGTRVDYRRGADGRPTSVRHSVFGEVVYDHDAAGRVVEARAGDALQSWEYEHGYPVRHTRTDARGTTVTRIDRDADGRIQQIDDGSVPTRYSYDDACQLVGARRVGARESRWAYDANGRLTAETAEGRDRTFRYDQAGQLLATTGPAGEATTYEYDGQGRRTQLVTDESRTEYVWDGRGWLQHVTGRSSAGVRETALWVNALGELADVSGTPIDWDTAAASNVPLRVGDTRVFGGPAGVTGIDDAWQAVGWRSARATDVDDPWQLLAEVNGAGQSPADGPSASPASAAGVDVAPDGTLGVAGLEWMGARAYDPAARGFLSTDPLGPVTGAAWGNNPYSYAGNDPLHAVDPSGLRPVSDEYLRAYAHDHRGAFVEAAENVGQWWSENWEFVAGGALVVAGGVLMATGVGGPIGIALIAAGADTIIQKATTGEVNWGQVIVSGAFGLVGGGLGSAIGRLAAGNAAEGAAENIVQYAASGQPITVTGLVTNAVTGAAVSAATGGVLSKVSIPTSIKKLHDELPTPTTSTRPDFIVDANGVAIPTSRTRLEKGLVDAGYSNGETRTPGTAYIMPDGNRIRVMDSAGNAPPRASFTNFNDGPLDAFTDKPPQAPRHLSKADRRAYSRDRTHIELEP